MKLKLLSLFAIPVFSLGFVSCDTAKEDPAKDTADAIEGAAEDAGDAVKEAADQ